MALFSVLRSSPLRRLILGRRASAASSALRITSSKRRVFSRAATSLSVMCKQSAKQGGADVWLGRAAMAGFASAVAVENFGVATPAPALALAVSGLVVGLAVFFLLQSGSRD
ncbi:stress enhanced protein 1, chloroplastic-like [Phragmites australis]|uniref:stress enhanced protein 1, chloroplastic-like n=1 Tax=Phragmites australis TaxID=29695 RepID=UPI002D78B586|nr:stress enhanced protein 1, chloroplastic-like [Phragmites australis]